MRQPNKEDKIGGWSISEIKTAFDNELTRVRAMRIQVTDQQMRPAHLLNAILLWVLTQPPPARDRIIRAGVAEYIRHLESDFPLSIDGIVVFDAPERPEGATPAVIDRPKKRKPKGSNFPAKESD